jgi:hypothetical protein
VRDPTHAFYRWTIVAALVFLILLIGFTCVAEWKTNVPLGLSSTTQTGSFETYFYWALELPNQIALWLCSAIAVVPILTAWISGMEVYKLRLVLFSVMMALMDWLFFQIALVQIHSRILF